MAVLAEDIRGTTFRKPRIGDQVWQNQPLVYLPDISRMIVSTQVREVDLHKIDIGKPASVRVDAYPQLALRGTVESIGVLADAKTGEAGLKYFRIIVSLDQSDPRLRPGMTARMVILADEPTGNLDARNSNAIMDLFLELHRQGTTLLVVTHDRDVARTADRILHIKEGLLHDQA